MKNRVHRPRVLEPSLRFQRERAARLKALRDPVISALYETPAWRALRAQVRVDAGGRCQWPHCLEAGRVVDHRTPHKGNTELFFNTGNVWLLCKRHHDRKTVLYDGGFGREVKSFWPMSGPRK